jgi:phosphoglycolate phosphatase
MPRLGRPRALFFDWHGTLADTFEAMYRAVEEMLPQLGELGLLTNRRRALFGGELRRVEQGGWEDLFDVLVCGHDVPRRKPAPDMVLQALRTLGLAAGPEVWFVGDSTTDVIAAREAGVRAIFYNGARWDPPNLVRIFPPEHPPDAIAGNFSALEELALPPRR